MLTEGNWERVSFREICAPQFMLTVFRPMMDNKDHGLLLEPSSIQKHPSLMTHPPLTRMNDWCFYWKPNKSINESCLWQDNSSLLFCLSVRSLYRYRNVRAGLSLPGQGDRQILGDEDPSHGRRDTVEANRACQEREEHPAGDRSSLHCEYVSTVLTWFNHRQIDVILWINFP